MQIEAAVVRGFSRGEMSKPALKALPAPVMISARTLSSRSHVSMAARKSASS